MYYHGADDADSATIRTREIEEKNLWIKHCVYIFAAITLHPLNIIFYTSEPLLLTNY